MKTSAELIAYVKSKVGCGYVWGTRGQICTLELIEQCRIRTKDNKSSGFYDGNNGYTYAEKCKRWLGKQVFDCGGLIDFWLSQDKNAQMYYSESTEKGKIATMPQVPGTLVFMYSTATGTMYHVGVFVGAGKVIEARGVAYGVVITDLAGRAWTHWGKSSQIDYTQTGEDDTMLQKGDTGQPVYDLQTAFKRLGYDIGAFKNMLDPTVLDGRDGDFGDTMVGCVKLLQSRHGLAQTGIVDAATYGKLAIDLAAIPAGSGITQTDLDTVKEQVITLTSQVAGAQGEVARLIGRLEGVAAARDVLDQVQADFGK